MRDSERLEHIENAIDELEQIEEESLSIDDMSLPLDELREEANQLRRERAVEGLGILFHEEADSRAELIIMESDDLPDLMLEMV